jgi:CheY-like chemotaxis protein
MDKKHILVIDDDGSVRLLMRKILEPAGYRVSEAKNALEAFSLDPKDPPNLVILDLAMPGISGHKVLASFKSDKSFRAPVLIVTAHTDPQSTQAVTAAGADGFLAKPVRREQLLDTVQELLAKRAAQP